jgi:hypothetical protein
MVSMHGYKDVTRQIKEETGWSIGDYIVNYVVEHYTGKWVDSRALMHDIYTAKGYKLEINQLTNTLSRWYAGAYRTDGLLEKDKRRRGTYRWFGRDELEAAEPLDDPVPYVPVSLPSLKVLPENPEKKYNTMDHDTDGIMIVTSIVGGYLVKIDGHLYTAKKLEL